MQGGLGIRRVVEGSLKIWGCSDDQIEKAYEVSANVAKFTFMDNQLPTGGWSCMHYPLEDDIPELDFEYKPLKGMVNVPDQPIAGSKTMFLPAEEIAGEYLGEMKSIETGVQAFLEQYKHMS